MHAIVRVLMDALICGRGLIPAVYVEVLPPSSKSYKPGRVVIGTALLCSPLIPRVCGVSSKRKPPKPSALSHGKNKPLEQAQTGFQNKLQQ